MRHAFETELLHLSILAQATDSGETPPRADSHQRLFVVWAGLIRADVAGHGPGVLTPRDPGIEPFLGQCDGELAAMARQYPRFRGQRQYLGTDRVELAPPVRVTVLAGYRARLGHDIAAEHNVQVLAVQAARSATVAGSVQHLQGEVRAHEPPAVLHVDIRLNA